MQQPMPQQVPQVAAQQQMQQQMVLCPVRVVYETQILVQPGDQIQPNQTLFINPQNPPPWAQSRPVQNPVIYVQQMPGNIVPSLPQHMDQNQLYLHQFQNFQQGMQVIPQQMVQNIQENRPNAIQMPNLIHQNMIQNFQNIPANMGQSITTLPDRTIQQPNYAQVHQNVAANMQIQQQTQISLASNNMVNRPIDVMTSMQNQNQQSQYTTQKMEMKPTYMNIVHMNQAANIGRSQPQVLTVNPIQNMQQTNVQTFAPNVVRPIKTESVGSQMTTPTYVNASQNTHITRIRKLSPSNNMNKINPNVGIRSIGQTQTYRPIQPRPQQFRPNMPNYSTLEAISQPNSMPIINQNVMNVNSNIQVQNINTNNVNIVKSEDLNTNRKRKSESPDDIHKKMAAIQVNITTPLKQVNEIKRPVEVAMPSNPLPRSEMTITPSILQPNNVKINIMSASGINNEMQVTEVKNTSNFIQNSQPSIKVNQNSLCMPSLDPIEPQNSVQKKDETQNATDKEKLIRNTVFTQARGRVLTDKETLSIVKENTLPEAVNVLKEITITPKEQPVIPTNEVKREVDVNPDANLIKTEIKTEVRKEEYNEKITNEIKKEKKVEEIKEDYKERPDMKVSLKTTNNNQGMFPMDRRVKQEKDYILTHVLDGIVIQESNVAFPIREPLIKRITQSTAQNNETKEVVKEHKSQETRPKVEETESTNGSADGSADEGITQGKNPFRDVAPATLKSWTTEQLSSHLFQNGWADEAALFTEHEIDGESLYLVSKTQLLAIGVEESHAESLCSFIKS